ncbi:MAG TPA: universal stress protein [Ktedonobacterales bacterium]|jgi:nucleotide-binding universal stress UspA family protein|nr:universal stress protein [Ktedonobacterales bacterium]
MRLLCAIGQRDGAQVIHDALALVGDVDYLAIIHVIDDQPRHGVEAQRGLSRRISPDRQREIALAEEAAGRVTLSEAESAARGLGKQIISIETRLERGKPEQNIVALAHELHVDLVALRAREYPDRFPRIGPPSVGHTARFVVDHAPCPVLLLRLVMSG